MLMWLLPTFLRSGTKLDDSDRPFAAAFDKIAQSRDDYNSIPFPTHIDKFQTSFLEGNEKELLKKNNEMSVGKRIGTILNTDTTHTSFSKVYNSLLCPQCIARIALINGVVVCILFISHFNIESEVHIYESHHFL